MSYTSAVNINWTQQGRTKLFVKGVAYTFFSLFMPDINKIFSLKPIIYAKTKKNWKRPNCKRNCHYVHACLYSFYCKLRLGIPIKWIFSVWQCKIRFLWVHATSNIWKKKKCLKRVKLFQNKSQKNQQLPVANRRTCRELESSSDLKKNGGIFKISSRYYNFSRFRIPIAILLLIIPYYFRTHKENEFNFKIIEK